MQTLTINQLIDWCLRAINARTMSWKDNPAYEQGHSMIQGHYALCIKDALKQTAPACYTNEADLEIAFNLCCHCADDLADWANKYEQTKVNS